MQRARSILATAYLLPHGRMLQALEEAARRGARVTVRLEGSPENDKHGALAAMNQAAVTALRRLGADAQLVDCAGGEGPRLHMKALVCDGVAFLDDRNFTNGGNETVLRDDDGADVDAIVAAANGEPHARGTSLYTNKADALGAEETVLRSASKAGTVEVETESFSCESSTYAELKRLAARGVHCRLIVSRREMDDKMRHAATLLEAAGVQVRAADTNEKFAITDGTRAWTGSADSTSVFPNGDQLDWGLCTQSAEIVNALREHFKAHWEAAKPV